MTITDADNGVQVTQSDFVTVLNVKMNVSTRPAALHPCAVWLARQRGVYCHRSGGRRLASFQRTTNLPTHVR